MMQTLHVILLAALGGVRMRDAIEAALYERKRPSVPRDEALEPAARVICRRADIIERQVEAQVAELARQAVGRGRS